MGADNTPGKYYNSNAKEKEKDPVLDWSGGDDEETGGGGGGNSQDWGAVAKDPWGSSPNMFETVQNVVKNSPKPTAITQNMPFIGGRVAGMESLGNPVDTPNPEPSPVPITPTPPQGSGQPLTMYPGVGAPVQQFDFSNVGQPPVNVPGNDWRMQGVTTAPEIDFRQGKSLLSGYNEPAQSVINGFPDRTQSNIPMSNGVNSFVGGGGTQFNTQGSTIDNGEAAKRQAALIMGLQELSRTPSTTTVTPKPKTVTPVKKFYGGGGAWGGGGSRGARWQDILSGMNWKI